MAETKTINTLRWWRKAASGYLCGNCFAPAVFQWKWDARRWFYCEACKNKAQRDLLEYLATHPEQIKFYT